MVWSRDLLKRRHIAIVLDDLFALRWSCLHKAPGPACSCGEVWLRVSFTLGEVAMWFGGAASDSLRNEMGTGRVKISDRDCRFATWILAIRGIPRRGSGAGSMGVSDGYPSPLDGGPKCLLSTEPSNCKDCCKEYGYGDFAQLH